MEIQITAIKFEMVNGKKTGKSFTFKMDPSRGKEIKKWLSMHKNKVGHYAILDVYDDMLPEQLPHFVQTNYEVGLSKENADRVIEILNC